MTRTTLISKLDKEFSDYIRKVHSKDGMCECFTCGASGHWKEFDCGHYMSRRNMSTRWDPDNAKPQCRVCNSFLGGNIEKYRERLGEQAELLEREANKTIKWDVAELEQMLVIFRKMNKVIR